MIEAIQELFLVQIYGVPLSVWFAGWLVVAGVVAFIVGCAIMDWEEES